MTGATVEKGSLSVGGKAAAHLHFSQQRGLAVGVEGQAASVVHGSCPCTQWRSLAKIGYEAAPTAVSRSVGIELFALGGLGRMPDADAHVGLSGIAGMQLAAPIRLSRGSEIWQADYYAGTELELVPDITTLVAIPTSGAPANAELALGISIRGYLYSAVLP